MGFQRGWLLFLRTLEPSRHIHSYYHVHICQQPAATLTAWMHSPEEEVVNRAL